MSDGTRLFVADGGDDRVLIYNTIPTVNATSADEVLGQVDFISSKITSAEDLFTPNLDRSASNATATPTALAWDGTNLYVTDPTSRRILVFTPTNNNIPINGIRNAASIEIFAFGTFTLTVTAIKADDQITLTINTANYVYKEVATDSVDTIVQALTNLINAGSGDPNVIATAQLGTGVIGLKARVSGAVGNNITIAEAVSTNAQVTVTTSGTTLTGGEDATTLAPGTFVSIFGQNLADTTVSAPSDASPLLRDLGGVQVYFDGIRSPVTFVSPTQINAQIPYEIVDSDGTISNSVSGYVRTQHADGSVSTTTAIGVPIAPQNPGIYTVQSNTDVRPALAYHSSSYATGTIELDGTVEAGDTTTIMIEDRLYGYTTQSTDTLADVRDAFVTLINANPAERVVATAGAAFATNIRLRAKVAGPEGDGIPFSAAVSANATITLGPTNTALCCANIGGAPLTADNPAVPGETFYIFATGLGPPRDPGERCHCHHHRSPLLRTRVKRSQFICLVACRWLYGQRHQRRPSGGSHRGLSGLPGTQHRCPRNLRRAAYYLSGHLYQQYRDDSDRQPERRFSAYAVRGQGRPRESISEESEIVAVRLVVRAEISTLVASSVSLGGDVKERAHALRLKDQAAPVLYRARPNNRSRNRPAEFPASAPLSVFLRCRAE